MTVHATRRRERDPSRRRRKDGGDPATEHERAHLRASLDAELEAELADTRAALPPYLAMHGTLGDARVVEIPGARKDGGLSPLERMPRLDAKLDAHTSDGRIALHGFTDMPIERQGEGRRLQAVLGSGAGNLRIRTGDGTITLKRSYIPAPPVPPAPPTAAAPPTTPAAPSAPAAPRR